MNPMPENSSQEVQVLFDSIKRKMGGKVPNIFRVMAHAPGILKSFLAMQEGAEKTSLSQKEREKIALFVSQYHGCEYCLGAHSAIGCMVQLSPEEIIRARKGIGENPKDIGLFTLVHALLESRGATSPEIIKKAEEAGITEQQIVEIIYLVALNTFTNYFNKSLHPELDFPEAPKI